MTESKLSSREPILIERLTRSHVREHFACGETSLDNYIQRLAIQHDERRVGRTFVAVKRESDKRVLGYYTLAAGRVSFETVPVDKKLPPRVLVPVVLLGRLAVDSIAKGQGLGEFLLMHALWRSQQVAVQAGVYAVEVDALHEEAAQFYLRYGFLPLWDSPPHMYLPMKTIEALSLDFPHED